MLARIGHPHQRRRTSVLLAILFSLTIFTLLSPAWRPYADPLPRWRSPGAVAKSAEEQESSEPPSTVPSSSPLSLVPELEEISRATPLADEYCHRRFTASYLEDLRDHAFQYCSAGEASSDNNNNNNNTVAEPSSSRLTCFHAHARSDNEADSFCLASGARLDVERGRFVLDCAVREPDADDTARGIVPLGDMRPYWYETGPRTIMDRFVSIERSSAGEVPAVVKATGAEPPRFVLLVKREGNGNLWHCLMEIWAMTMSFDVLRMSRSLEETESGKDNQAAPALFRFPDDMERTQMVVLDDHDLDGPTYDLWRMFSHQPAVRLRDVIADPSRLVGGIGAPMQLILPLPGASNPLWQNDWELRGCGSGAADAPLLRLFVRRVLDRLGIPLVTGPRVNAKEKDENQPEPGSESETESAVTVTFLDRQGTRRLLGQGVLLERLRAAYPAGRVTVQSVDMAGLSLVEQVRIVQQTDVLVGVHGAALTHAMFMREAGGGAVVEIQPAGLGYRGFRNLAAMRGLRYFSAQAEIVAPGERADEAEEKAETETTTDDKTHELTRRDGEWQFSNVRIEEDRFLQLLDAAIKSQYNVGQRSWDVV